MIGRLTGRVVEESADGTVVLDVAGVGYELTVPLGTVGRAGVDPAAPITLFVHTHVREDALLLYGFASREDRAAFRVLIGISNIGPKIATNILSALSAGELATAVARGETNRLTAIPGVGKKTAERIVLELKDKLIAPPTAKASGAPAAPPPPTGKAELLQGALTRMGFKPAEAERALTSLGARVEAEPLGDLVREALALLSR
ncbi:MAG: Holliday junction branch migration protein RuvA [Polyangiaceae bacterium]|nr:Holliday junction branch migration protein RuvA [Polyangiaceae bacterium]NUQ78667.1 Holliday junction branch migration protein RuvA [Polyangiaceae bacterium]